MAASHYEELGIDYCLEENSDSTELAKLLSTTYYGLCIAWHGEMKKMCDKYNVRFDVIDEWTKTYNSGYKELGMPHVVRPALYPPKNGIGGHCIVSNVEILLNDNESLALEGLAEMQGFDTSAAHTAYHDAYTSLKILKNQLLIYSPYLYFCCRNL